MMMSNANCLGKHFIDENVGKAPTLFIMGVTPQGANLAFLAFLNNEQVIFRCSLLDPMFPSEVCSKLTRKRKLRRSR